MIKNNKILFIFGTLGLLLVFAGPVFAQVANNTNTINSCPTANPSGALRCPAGQYFINGTCRTEAQSGFTACTTSDRNENFNCTNNGCVCEPAFPIDCRSTGITGYQKCLSAGTLPPVTCADANAQVVQCTGACGECRRGFERIGGTGLCVASCDPDTELRTAEGCVTLESVSGRVEAIENLQLCHFDQAGAYVNDTGQACPQTFDPTNINGQLSTAQTRFTTLVALIFRMLPAGEVVRLLSAILTGNNVAADYASLITLLQPSPILAVRRALVAESLEDRSLNFADFGMTCTSGQVIQFNGTNWVCGDVEAGGGGGGGVASSVFVGFTTVKADSEWGGSGYRPVNNFCLNGPWESGYGDLAGSHVCSAQEIINSYITAEIPVRTRMGRAAGVAWIFNGPPAHLNTLVNDCSGWQVVSNTRYGAVWNFDNDRGLIQQCDSDLKFACCR